MDHEKLRNFYSDTCPGYTHNRVIFDILYISTFRLIAMHRVGTVYYNKYRLGAEDFRYQPGSRIIWFRTKSGDASIHINNNFLQAHIFLLDGFGYLFKL